MDIILVPAGNGQSFTFPALPEQVKVKYTAKYQGFDIISLGSVKVPKGTEVSEISWDGEFFGTSKMKESIVRQGLWKEPVECLNILRGFSESGTVLNLIVTGTWINMDVTISSIQSTAYGAYGNIKYSVTFLQKKELRIYDTSELNIMGVAETMPRDSADEVTGEYVVKKGDTLWKIAAKHCGGSSNWPKLYDANVDTIEAEAKKRGKSGSDRGHWIWPGTILIIPAIAEE